MALCGVCKENETGRLIEGVAVCSKCFLDGYYNLPENQAKLRELLGTVSKSTVSEAPTPRRGRKKIKK